MAEKLSHYNDAKLPGPFEVRDLPEFPELTPEQIAEKLSNRGIDPSDLHTAGQFARAAIRIGVRPEDLTG